MSSHCERCECFRRIRSWFAHTVAVDGPHQRGKNVMLPSTPHTTLELANMLRDPMLRQRCPFGQDFEEHALQQRRQANQSKALRLVPWWLALMELHGDGYRHGMGHGQELPFRCDLIVSSAMPIGGDCVADDSNAS